MPCSTHLHVTFLAVPAPPGCRKPGVVPPCADLGVVFDFDLDGAGAAPLVPPMGPARHPPPPHQASEWQLNRLVSHPDVVSPLAFVAPPDAPALGIVLELLAHARPLGGPPTFATITRDNPTLDPAKSVLATV